MKIKDLYNKNCLMIEMIVGLLIGPVVYFLSRYVIGTPILLPQAVSLYVVLAQIQGTLLGFILATLSIVFTQLSQPRFNIARKHPSFSELWMVFLSAIKWLGIGVIVALIAIMSDPMEIMIFPNLSFASVAGLRVCRCIWVLRAVINASLEPEKV